MVARDYLSVRMPKFKRENQWKTGGFSPNYLRQFFLSEYGWIWEKECHVDWNLFWGLGPIILRASRCQLTFNLLEMGTLFSRKHWINVWNYVWAGTLWWAHERMTTLTPMWPMFRTKNEEQTSKCLQSGPLPVASILYPTCSGSNCYNPSYLFIRPLRGIITPLTTSRVNLGSHFVVFRAGT